MLTDILSESCTSPPLLLKHLDVSTRGARRPQHKETASRSIGGAGTPLPTVRTRPYVVPTFSRTGESVSDSTAPHA